jgi:hypothetical protein
MLYFVPFSQVAAAAVIPDPDRGAWGTAGQRRRERRDAGSGHPGISSPARAAICRTSACGPYADLLARQPPAVAAGGRRCSRCSAALALLVGAMGLYAAFAHAVTLRRREMAIRLAIGARPRGVVALVLREALALPPRASCAAGSACSSAAARCRRCSTTRRPPIPRSWPAPPRSCSPLPSRRRCCPPHRLAHGSRGAAAVS